MPQSLALVMISNLGRADGGRETWAYQFIPRLLSRNPELSIKLYGLRIEGQPDTSHQLRSAIPSEGRQRLRTHFFRIGRSWIPNSLKMIWAMFRRDPDLEADNFDLALGVGSFVELLCMLVAPGLRRSPKAIWLRTIYLDEKSHRIPGWLRPLAAVAEKAVLRMADLIIANGDDTAAYYRARGLKVEVIKNAVDLERWRMPPPILEQPIKIAFIGRLAVGKGINEFADLSFRIRDEERENGEQRFELHLIGDGPRSPLVRRALDEGLMRDHGSIPNADLSKTMAHMDVCVALTHAGNPNHSSGAGVSHSLLEQMAARKVIIAWDNPAFRNVLDEESSFLVKQGSVDGLLAALDEIASAPDNARHRAQQAFVRASRYGYDAHMERFEKLTAPFLKGAALSFRGASHEVG